MEKYISCKLACAEVDKGDLLVGNNAEWAKEIICRTPAADVVEVVRRKYKTNGEKIRSMNDRKLAEYLASLNGGGTVRYEQFLKWLKEEAEK